MELAELHAVSDELQVMRRQAFDEGYTKAVDELNSQIAEIHKEQERVAQLRREWQGVIANVQATYLAHNQVKLEMDNDLNPYLRPHNALSLPADMEEFAGEMTRLVKMGKDFEIILKHIETNEVLKGAWNKVLVAMRLIQE